MLAKIHQWWLARKLVGKHAILMLAATCFTGPLAFLALYALLSPAFDQIEQDEVAAQKGRTTHALSEFEDRLKKATMDYAVWDDMYDYVANKGHAFELATLTPVSHVNNGIDYRAIVRADGTIVWSSAVDLKSATFLADESEKLKAVFRDPAFFNRANTTRQTTSYVRTARGVYLISTGQIIRSDETGVPRGFLANGILLDEQSLSDALQVKVRLNYDASADTGRALLAAPAHSLSAAGDKAIVTKFGIFDINQRLLTSIEFSTPRTISALGRKAIDSASYVLAIAILALSLLLSYGLRRITVRRVQFLENYVRNMRPGGHALPKGLTEGSDEIASLSREFETLFSNLASARDELEKKSYVQGKADSAAGMLHNVRNALAPVRVMQEKWLREETLPFRANMQRALTELSDEATDPARKADLEKFLLSAARQIALTSEGRLAEMHESKQSIDQIAQILGGYDFDTSGKRAAASVDILQLIQQEAKALEAREGPLVTWLIPESMPKVLGNRVHLTQVLGNICVNAHEAMTAAGTPEMRLRVTFEEDLAANTVSIRIRDNGDGIDPDNIAQIFHRGYSTRAHKSGGIGMHWSANAMRSMGGSITLESAGIGQGATAILTLPRAAAASETVAESLAA
jgi:signal transduction histidine kinase